MKLFSHRSRPVHLGPYPLERLPRLDDPAAIPPAVAARRSLPALPVEPASEGPTGAGHAYATYVEMYDNARFGPVADAAPIPDDPSARSQNLKAGLYFLDADQAGCCVIPDGAAEPTDHRFAVVIVIAHSRKLSGRHPGDAWIDGTRQVNSDLRAAELAVITAGYIVIWASRPTPTRPAPTRSTSPGSRCRRVYSNIVAGCCVHRSSTPATPLPPSRRRWRSSPTPPSPSGHDSSRCAVPGVSDGCSADTGRGPGSAD